MTLCAWEGRYPLAAAAILPHIPNDRLATLVYMNVLNTDHLRSAVPQTP